MSTRWLRGLALTGFAATSVGALSVSTVREIESTGAIPADEFLLAGILYDGLPAMGVMALVAGAATLLACAAEAWAQRRRRIFPVLTLCIGLCMLTAALTAPSAMVVLASALLVLRRLLERHQERSAGHRSSSQVETALESVSWRDLAWYALCISFLCGVSAFGLTFSESVVYTARFAPDLFGVDHLARFRWWLPELAVMFGLHWGVLYVAPLALFKLVQPRVRRWLPASSTAALLVSGLLAFILHTCTILIVGDEIRETGAYAETAAFATLLGVLWFHSILSRFPVEGPALGLGLRTPGRAWTVAALAPLSVPSGLFPAPLRRLFLRRESTFFLLHAATAGLLLAFLAYTSYPELDDFRSFFLTVGVLIATHVGTFGLLALSAILWSPRTRTVRIGLAGAGAGIAVLLLAQGFRALDSHTSMILHEYSRFGFVVKEASLRRRLLPPNRLGYDPLEERQAAQAPLRTSVPLAPPLFDGPRKPPIFFVLWDAGRPDRMGCYGYERPTSPRVDELAADSVVFDRAYTMATATTCSVRHTFTGCYSSRYMLAQDHRPFFVHVLRAVGYQKYFITALGSDYNGVSMDSFYRQGLPLEVDGAQFLNVGQPPGGADGEAPDHHKTEGVMQAWREAVAEGGPEALDGTFSFLHLTGTHFPWGGDQDPPVFGESQSDLYDGEVLECDRLTGQCLDLLRELGVYDDAIIVLFADHGTGLLEHGRYAGFLPYEEQIRVPLVVKVPGILPRSCSEVVGLIDLAPTVLDLVAGVQARPGTAYDGISLRPLLEEQVEILDRDCLFSLCAFEDAYAVIERGRWKLHYHRAYDYALLFDLHSDPMEKVNLYDERPEIVQRLTEKLEAFLWKGKGRYANPYHYRAWSDLGG